jgi:hypothetical protein
MTSLITKYIEVMGADLTLREASRKSPLLRATLTLTGRFTLSGLGATVQEAMQKLHSELEAYEAQA